MNSVTLNSPSDEGSAFRIPQLDDGGPSGRADASTEVLVEAAAPLAATPIELRRSMVATLRASLEAAEARVAWAEQRALRAEARLARYGRHCICRSAEVADAVEAEARQTAEVVAQADPEKAAKIVGTQEPGGEMAEVAATSPEPDAPVVAPTGAPAAVPAWLVVSAGASGWARPSAISRRP